MLKCGASPVIVSKSEVADLAVASFTVPPRFKPLQCRIV